MVPKRYIVWSAKHIDLNNQFQKRWYFQQVLLHGRAEDVAQLDSSDLKALLPALNLPPAVRSLWERYYSSRG